MIFALISTLLLKTKVCMSSLIPDKTFPITLTSTNSEDISDYTIRFSSTVSFNSDCQLDLWFPAESYLKGMGLDFTPQVKILQGDNLIELNSTIVLNDSSITISPKGIDANTAYKIVVTNVKNPNSVGGIGSLRLSASCGTQMVANNTIFSSIAISEPKQKLQSVALTIKSDSTSKAGEITNYRITFVPSQDILKYVSFELEFPSAYDFSDLIQMVEDFPSLSPCEAVKDQSTGFIAPGNFECSIKNNIVSISGLTSMIKKSSVIIFDINGIKNPLVPGLTRFFKMKIKLMNSNYTYQYDDNVIGKFIRYYDRTRNNRER